MEALLTREELVTPLLTAAESDAGEEAVGAALELAEEMGLNRKGLERLAADGAAAGAATLQQHVNIARCVYEQLERRATQSISDESAGS